MKLIVDTYVYLGCKEYGFTEAIRGGSPAVDEAKIRMWGRPGCCSKEKNKRRGILLSSRRERSPG